MAKTSSKPATKTAFIGLGNMGLPMACNLVKQHSGVSCFDISPSARTAAKRAGLPVSKSASDAVRGADIIITMLPAGVYVRDFFTGKNGVLSRVRRGALIADCSTTSPDEAREMSQIASARGVRFIDAPVSGGIGGARAGTLSFLAGGASSDVKVVRPLLSSMGANIFHAGKTGAGQAAKICNNMMLSVQMIGACEALALGQKMGLSGAVLSDIMKKSSGGNWVFEKYNPLPGVMPGMPASNNYRGGFLVDLMMKDSDLAMAAAKASSASVPMGALANQIYRLHQSQGAGEKDFSSVIQMFNSPSKGAGK